MGYNVRGWVAGITAIREKPRISSLMDVLDQSAAVAADNQARRQDVRFYRPGREMGPGWLLPLSISPGTLHQGGWQHTGQL